MKCKEREELWMAWALLIFMLALIPSVHAEVFNCSSCSDCSQNIQAANPGDIIVLTADISITTILTTRITLMTRVTTSGTPLIPPDRISLADFI